MSRRHPLLTSCALYLLAGGCKQADEAPAPHPAAPAPVSAALRPAPPPTAPAPPPATGPAGDAARGAIVWRAEGPTQTFPSPRCADLNGDGVRDVVLGHGVTAFDPARTGARGSITAHDGRTGALLWEHATPREVVGSAALVDLNADGVPDVAVGGRDGLLVAVDGRNGKGLWAFRPADGAGSPGRLNHYSPAVVRREGRVELVTASGGDVSIPAFSPRPPGHLLVVDGATGALVAAAQTPDGGETFTSPLIRRGPAGDERVLFGTGGETFPGSLWDAPLADLLRGDLQGAIKLVGPVTHKGLIAPPALADLDGDGVEDVAAAFFDGRLVVVDGRTGELRKAVTVADAETHQSPVVARLVGDSRPDVVAFVSSGVWPRHTASLALVVDGATSALAIRRPLDGIIDGTPVAGDVDGDGRDEVLYWERRGDRSVVLLWRPGQKPEPLWWYDGRTPSTPWIGDLDGDGRMDWLHAYMRPPRTSAPHPDHAFEAGVTWVLERRALPGRVPARVAFGGYLGTDGDSRFR